MRPRTDRPERTATKGDRASHATGTTLAPSRLHDRLSRETCAEICFDRGRRGLYVTDASLYQIEPLGVVLSCGTVDDVIAAMRIAAEEGGPVLPRVAATSLSGQTVGQEIVLDA